MTTDIFNEFDEQSQASLKGLKILDFYTNQKNILENPFEETRTDKSFQEISAFKNSPFGQYWNINIHEWAKSSFGSAKILDKKNVVIADKSLKISHTQADFYNTLIGNELSKYNFVVYSDPDGEKVLEMYNDPKNVPNKDKPYEVLVFIETDDGMFDFGKIVRIKFGTSVIDDLKNKYFQELPWKDNDPKDIANEFIIRSWSTSISAQKESAIDKELNSEDFKDLLIKAIQYEYDNQKFDDFSWFVVLLEGADYVGLNIPNWCFSLGKWFRERKYNEDKYWNGDLPEKEYTPAFMADHIFYEKKEDREKAIKELFEKPFNYLRDGIYENLGNNDPISKRLRQDLYIKIDELQDTVNNFIKDVLSEVNIPEGYGQTYIKHYHAFILGLYNGILEFLAGICDLLAIAVLLCREELGFRMSDMITEKFETFVNDLFYDTLETLKKIGAKAIEVFKDFMNWYQQFLEYDGKSYKILKELGELVPDILTFVIPVLKGSKAVKLAQAGEEMVEVAEKQVAKEATEELSEAEAKHIAKSAREALEKGTATQASTEAAEKLEQEIIEKVPVQLEEVVVKSGLKFRFSHVLSSGVIIAEDAKKGTYLIGGWVADFQFVLKELDYPVISDIEKLRKGFDFPLPKGQKFNLLNVSEEVVTYFSNKGGFFNRVNAKWVDAAVERGEDIILVTRTKDLYKPIFIDGKRVNVLTGYGKEVHRFEWKHKYRFDSKSKMMIPPNKAEGLKSLTKFEDNKIIN